MSEKIRTTISIDKNIYQQLDDMGLIRDRKISMVINQLLLDYLKNYNISILEKNNKNFIEECIENSVSKILSTHLPWLKGAYRLSAYNAELSHILHYGNNALSKARENARIDYGKMNAKQTFWESPLVNPDNLPLPPSIPQKSPTSIPPEIDDIEYIDLTAFKED